MSAENVQVVRRVYEDVARRRWGSPELFFADVVYRPVASFTEARECHGIDEYVAFLDSFMEAWAQDFTIDPLSLRDYGDAVVARVQFSGHARTSGIEISGRMFHVFWLRDRRIFRAEDFLDRAEALEAVRAGASEPRNSRGSG